MCLKGQEIKEFFSFFKNLNREEAYRFLINSDRRISKSKDEYINAYKGFLGIFFDDFWGGKQIIDQDELTFTRVRINEGNVYNFLSEISYPPVKYAKLGRANLVGDQVFYCSDGPGTALFESRPREGQFITTTNWIYTKVPFVSLSLGVDVQTYSNFEELLPYMQGMHDYLRDIFIENYDDNPIKYYRTALLCKGLISQEDGLRFPSVASNILGNNFVISKEKVDLYLKFESSRIQKVFDWKSPCDFKVKCMFKSTDLVDDRIIWERERECDGHLIDEGIFKH